ncbi:hypothetical protein AMATHDRAFT_155921, partial [Amanita thiersii Skay4041]
QHTITQQGQTITQLQAQAAVGSPPVQGQPFRGPKMATPLIYDGAMATCKGFINSCQLYMSAKPQEFLTLQIKITWVLGFMQMGMAQMFCDHFLVYMNLPDYQTQYEESVEPNKIKLLYCDIYKVFGDPNKQAMAIQEITTIKQGSQSAEEHVQLFKQAYMRSGYGETAGIHEFKWSLNSPLLDKCMAIPELPSTLEKWYKLVIHLDRQWRQVVAERKMFTTCGGSSTGGQTGTTQHASQQGQTQGYNQHQGLTQQALHRNRTPFRCYNCGQTGHMA